MGLCENRIPSGGYTLQLHTFHGNCASFFNSIAPYKFQVHLERLETNYGREHNFFSFQNGDTIWIREIADVKNLHIIVHISNALLVQFNHYKSELWHPLMTFDGTCIHHYIPRTKIQPQQWTVR